MNAEHLLTHFDRLADAPDAIPRLRRFILDLAVRGKLVAQNPNDEPAGELLKRIAAEKKRHQANGSPKKSLPPVSENEKTFPVPESWEWVRLGDVSTSLLGKTLNKAKNKGSYKPYLRSVNVYWFQLSLSDIKEMKFEEQELEKYALCKGDVLVCEGGEAGRAAVWNNEMKGIYYQNALHRVRFFGRIESNYFVFALNSDFNNGQLANYCTGVTIKHLTSKRLAKYCFPLPPIVEQHRIVAKVDELMALCDRLETTRKEQETSRDRLAAASLARLNAPDPDPAVFQNHAAFALNNLTPLTIRPDQIKALRQTILNLAVRGRLVEQDPEDEPAGELLKRIAAERNDLVSQKAIRREKPLAAIDADELPFKAPSGWEWSRIGDAVLFTQYGTSAKSSPSEQGVHVLTMGNIQDGMVIWGNEKRIPDTAEELPALYLKKFDLLYNRTNSAELVGKTGIYLGEDDCRTFASYLIRLRVSREHISPHFLNLTMNTSEFRETQIVPLIKKQTGQANVNGTALKNMLVPVPPLAEQHRIVAKVDELMAVCDRLEGSLATGEETRGRLVEAVLREALESDRNRRSAS